MTNEEMKATLDQANIALVDRIGKQPYMPLNLTLHNTGMWGVTGYIDSAMKERFTGGLHDTPQQAFEAVFAAIEALPAPEDAVNHEYLKRIAHAVDFATENSLADEYVTPLRGVTMAMTENLLTHSKAGVA